MGGSVYLLALLALIFLMGISAHLLGRFFRVPSIVFLLFFGIILGPEVLNIINTSGFEQESHCGGKLIVAMANHCVIPIR